MTHDTTLAFLRDILSIYAPYQPQEAIERARALERRIVESQDFRPSGDEEHADG